MGKPTICICENKDADQLRGNREADQRLCFRYTDSTISLLSTFKIPSFSLYIAVFYDCHRPVCVRPGGEPQLLIFSRTGS